jgi:hypothetical protein
MVVAAAAAVALVAVVGLAVGLISLVSTSSAAPTVDPAHRPLVAEGQTDRSALNQVWAVAGDPNDRGLAQGWQNGRFGGQAVHVPNVVNPAPITGPGGVANYQGSIAWYRTAVSVPRAGAYLLRFESVNYRARVWLDGKPLGAHQGEYLPFEFRFQATPGTHTLVVRADFRSPDQMARDGFHRTWFNFGGINGEVTIRPAGDSELFNPTFQTRLAPASDGSVAAVVNVDVGVLNNRPGRSLTVSGTLSNGDQSIDLHFPDVTLLQGKATTVHALATVNNPSLWAPGHPSLYDLQLHVGDETAYRARVGLREVETSNGRLYLNGKRLVLRGASIQEDFLGHGDALTPQDQNALVSELEAIHANATRSQHPLDAALLERLDAAGILVWQGIGPVDSPGSWNSVGPQLTRLAERRARITVRQAQLHPSIIAWNLANEIAGNGHRGGQIEYVENTAATLHRIDPGRLVALDVWGPHPPRYAGPMYSNIDAIGETNYLGWYEQPFASAVSLRNAIQARLGSLRRVFPKKVLVVSEFGAEANYLNPDSRPGSYSFQARLLGLHVNSYAHMPSLSGMLVWDMRDFAVAPTFAGGSIRHVVGSIALIKGLNQKGLINYEGRPKPAFNVIATAFGALKRAGSY